jgi:hypothetical protein
MSVTLLAAMFSACETQPLALASYTKWLAVEMTTYIAPSQWNAEYVRAQRKTPLELSGTHLERRRQRMV